MKRSFQISESQVADTFEKILTGSVLTVATKEFALTALAKLADRLESETERIYSLIRQFTAHMNLELQQRSVEFGVILARTNLKHGLLERMPIIAHNSLNSAAAPISEEDSLLGDAVPQEVVTTGEPKEVDLLDGLFGGGSAGPASTAVGQQGSVADDILGLFGNNSAPAPTQPQTSNGIGGLEDLLGGLGLGSTAPAPQTQVSPPVAQPKKSQDDIFSEFFGVQQDGKRGVIAVNEKGIEIQLFVDAPLSSGTAIVRLICSNNNPAPVENFVLQAAVTKVRFLLLSP